MTISTFSKEASYRIYGKFYEVDFISKSLVAMFDEDAVIKCTCRDPDISSIEYRSSTVDWKQK
jgi:hypothetical protein